jgi:hypothetical protein
MKPLIMQDSPVSCHFLPLISKDSPQHPILKRPQPINFTRSMIRELANYTPQQYQQNAQNILTIVIRKIPSYIFQSITYTSFTFYLPE